LIKHQPRIWLIFLSSIAFFLIACSFDSAKIPVADSRIINSGSSFGQSFTAQNDGLSGISILLAPSLSSTSGSLVFHLRTNPLSKDDLATVRLPLSKITHQAYYKFDFPPQRDSQRKDYYLQVDVESDGQVKIYTAAPDSYLDGALYENQIPQESQLVFQLGYDRILYLLGLIQLAFKWVAVLIIGLFAFVIPGWACFSLLWRGWKDLNWGSKLGLSCGLSLAIYPLLLLWTGIVGLHLGPFYAWVPMLVGLLVLGWKNRRIVLQMRFPIHPQIKLHWDQKKHPPEIVLAGIAFIVVLGMLVLSRFWVIRSLDIPLFGDSYQHTMITQLIIDHGGLFNSWEPYANLTTFTYHFGFHSAAAVFHWVTGASAAKAVLWMGQLINIIAILGLYPLAFKISKNHWAGVVAMLVGGLLSPMPMYYINWGRFTQLAGQAILPATIWIAWSLLERPWPEFQDIQWTRKLSNWKHLPLDLGSLTIAWLSLGGVALTHYRILILVVLFFPACALLTFAKNNYIVLLRRIAWIGVGGAILFLPWFIHLLGGKILAMLTAQITTLPSSLSTSSELINNISNIPTYLPIIIWILFFFCIFWGLWKHSKGIAVIIIWWFLIILATNPNWIGLPGAGAITNFAVLIAFYIPAGLVIGSATEWIRQKIIQLDILLSSDYKSKIASLLVLCFVLVLLCALGIWGVSKRVKDLNISTYALVTRPDIRAMTWIREHQPENAIFLVNSFFAYNNSVVVGSDAGWWIPILTGRKTTLPPLTYGFEEGVSSAFTESANYLTGEINKKGIISPEIISLLLERNIHYVYVGQRQGTINYTGPNILDPELMNNNPNFKVLYHQDRVWIFEVIP
jgi:hypothetical protein